MGSLYSAQVFRMKLLQVLSFLSCLSITVLGKNVGSINVDGIGEVYILTHDWAAPMIEIHDNGFTMTGNTRLYFGDKPDDVFNSSSFWQTNLLDNNFAYTVDLSNVSCGCNAAAYFVDMPGTWAGNSGDYYCDANYGAGNNMWCPEYDVMESNKYTMMSALHTCEDQDNDGRWETCDQGGCSVNAYYVDPDMMCPEDRCTINTNKPFTVSHFQNSTMFTTNLEQEGKKASYAKCNHGGYVDNMADSLNNMVFVASLWSAGDMSWLDGMTGCERACDIYSSSVTFNNFSLID